VRAAPISGGSGRRRYRRIREKGLALIDICV
jgi:hypothetical protein